MIGSVGYVDLSVVHVLWECPVLDSIVSLVFFIRTFKLIGTEVPPSFYFPSSVKLSQILHNRRL